MRKIWKLLNVSGLTRGEKNGIFILLSILLSALLGALGYLVIGRILLPGRVWFVCFVGYSAVFGGFFGSILYLFNHEFKKE